MNQVTILTNDIRSGKSSALANLFKEHKSACGCITPYVDQQKIMVLLSSKIVLPYELNNSDKADYPIVEVGRFILNKKCFQLVYKEVSDHAPQSEWVVLDEVGKLELADAGHSRILWQLLQSGEFRKLLLVVRQSLLESVYAHFRLDRYAPIIITDARDIIV
jgi:nucleoside-triphosphatase THEP1